MLPPARVYRVPAGESSFVTEVSSGASSPTLDVCLQRAGGREYARAGACRCESWSSRTNPASSSSCAWGSRRKGSRSTQRTTAPPGSAWRSPSPTSWSSSTCCSRASTGSACSASCAARGPSMPVLILSARSDLPTKLRSFGLGANDYLSKPFSFDELVARVRVHLRRGHDSGESSSLRLGAARARSRPAPGPERRLGDRPLRPRVPAPLPPRVARRRGREPGAAPLGRVGLQLRPGLERRRRLRAPAAQEARADLADRDGPACRLSPCGRLARSRSAGASSRVGCLAVMIASPTWETIPFHVIWISLTVLYGFKVWSPSVTGARARRRRDRHRAPRSSPTRSTACSSGASSSRCR